MLRMDDKKIGERVMKANVNCSRLRGKPKFVWMDDVKQSLGRRDQFSVGVSGE